MPLDQRISVPSATVSFSEHLAELQVSSGRASRIQSDWTFAGATNDIPRPQVVHHALRHAMEISSMKIAAPLSFGLIVQCHRKQAMLRASCS
jgi:hypothetical protein